MAGVNKAIIVGNLGRDPELKYLENGTAICRLSVATTRRWTNNDGETVEETEWHRVSVWGKQAESCEKFLSKGRQVYVEGRLRTSKYKDKEDGSDKYSTEIVAETVQFLGGKESDGGRGRDDGGGRDRDRGEDRGDRGRGDSRSRPEPRDEDEDEDDDW